MKRYYLSDRDYVRLPCNINNLLIKYKITVKQNL